VASADEALARLWSDAHDLDSDANEACVRQRSATLECSRSEVAALEARLDELRECRAQVALVLDMEERIRWGETLHYCDTALQRAASSLTELALSLS
jgi:hypothetical protein